MCSALFFAVILSSAPFGFPLPAYEWHVAHFWDVKIAAPWSAFVLPCAAAAEAAATTIARLAKHRATLSLIVPPPVSRRSLPPASIDSSGEVPAHDGLALGFGLTLMPASTIRQPRPGAIA